MFGAILECERDYHVSIVIEFENLLFGVENWKISPIDNDLNVEYDNSLRTYPI